MQVRIRGIKGSSSSIEGKNGYMRADSTEIYFKLGEQRRKGKGNWELRFGKLLTKYVTKFRCLLVNMV